MKLKKYLSITIFFLIPSISALALYCPTQLICDSSGKCTTNESNGFNVSEAYAFINQNGVYVPGVYGFTSTQTHQGDVKTGDKPSCWYQSLTDNTAVASAATNNIYYIVGSNWIWHFMWETCPSDNWGPHVYALPQACAFSTTPPSK